MNYNYTFSPDLEILTIHTKSGLFFYFTLPIHPKVSQPLTLPQEEDYHLNLLSSKPYSLVLS